MIETSSVLLRKSSAIFGNLLKSLEICEKCLRTFSWPSECARWWVARAFPPAKLWNSIFGSQRRTLYFKWSKTLEHLNWSKFFFVFLPLWRYFWLFWKERWRKWHLFLVTTLNIRKAVFKTVQAFLSQKKQYLQWKPHLNRIKWRKVTGY